MASLQELQPQEVLRWFYQLAAIPHGSGNTKVISDFCVKFAEERGLEHYQDELNNVIIIAPAAPGYEAAAPLILQGHLDMVCAKAPGCNKDMIAEGLTLSSDGEWLRAEGTSLGADDSIAVAMMLAILDDPALPRPRLEAVFTVDEEIGMLGAAGLDASPLRGNTVLNIDSEAEGVFTVGCAGGVLTRIGYILPAEAHESPVYTLTLSGLTGGHSGEEIDKGRGNANLLAARVLRALSALTPLRLVSIAGGEADNAIPVRCTAEFTADAAEAVLTDAAEKIAAELHTEYAATDPALHLTLQSAQQRSVAAVTAEASRDFLDMLLSCPNGVQAMSADIPGLVETSLNLGVLTLENGSAQVCFLIRSSSAAGKRALAARLAAIAAENGGEIFFEGDYPPWEYRAESPLRERMTRIYRAQYGAEPRIAAIHAGLECGILASKIPDMDCVSIGPDIPDIHTPGERLFLPSVQRVWAFVKELLKESR